MEAVTQESSERPFRNARYDLAEAYSRFLGDYNSRPTRYKDQVMSDAQSILDGKTFVEEEYDLARRDGFIDRLQNTSQKQSPEEAVAIAYRAVFKREVDGEGLRIYSDQIRTNRPIRDIVEELLRSEEYRQQALDQIYQEVLERDIDEIGKNIYLDQLRAGRPLSEVAQEIKHSDEYRDIPNRNDRKVVFKGSSLEQTSEILNKRFTVGRRGFLGFLGFGVAGIFSGNFIKDIFSGSEGKPVAEATPLGEATSVPPKATPGERQATATPPKETPESRAPATSSATSTATAASTETATSTATTTPEKIAQKRNVMKEIILPKLTDTVKQRREEKSKQDPDFLSRVDSDLNRDRVNMLFTGIGKEGSLTDSILLVSYHVPTNKMSLISFPRDLQSPEVMKKSGSAGSSRINQTLSFGGIDLAKLTIENATGLSVDFAVVERFDTLIDLVNKTVGEIEIDLKEPINDPQYPALTGNGFDPLHISAGKHRVNGETALKIARSRLSTSDYDRAGRQQLVLRSLLREWANYGGRDILRAIPLLNRIQSTVQQKIDSKSLQLDFDVNQVAWSQIQALTASMPQIMADKVRGAEWEMGEEPESDSYVISNKNFIVSADIPGVAITKIKGGNPYTANPRRDYWRAVRESVKAFITKDDGVRVDVEKLSSPSKEQRILRPQELSYPEVERWIGKLRGTHDSVLSESLFTKEIAAMSKEQREKVLDAIAEAHADALIERYGDSEAIIGLDPGHGGQDRGSSGASREGTIYEENLTWDLANRIAEKIFTKTSGRYHSVILRPEKPVDEDLDRDGNISAIESIQKRKALLMEVEEKLRPNPQDRGKNIVYLSIHTNGAPDPNSNISGTEIYWPNQKGEANERYRTSSKSLAQDLQSKLIKYIRDAGYNVYDRGAKEDPDRREPAGNSETTQGPYVVLGSPKLDRFLRKFR